MYNISDIELFIDKLSEGNDMCYGFDNGNEVFGSPETQYTLSGEPTKKKVVDKTGYIDNIITIYDINGNIIKKYEGKFAILEHTDSKLIFQIENGKKHTIHISTGLITIDQK